MDTNNSNPLYIDSSAFLKKLSIELIGLKPINIGNIVAPVYQNECAIAIGPYAGYYEQGECAIAIGKQAGQTNQATQAIAIGVDAGQLEQGAYALAFGLGAGNDNQGTAAIAMGVGAGEFEQDEEAIAIGSSAGRSKQSTQAIAIGSSAGQNVQGQYAVALGYQAGLTGQGLHAIAIGNQAGKTDQPSNSIVLNATGGVLSSVTKSNALYVAPVSTGTTSNVLYYNSSSKEIVYGAAASGVPNGTDYSDYLFWDNNSLSWKVGQKEIHLGSEAGLTGQSSFAVALGHLAGRNTQNQGAIAIGYQAGQYSQGTFAIGIGYGAARSNQSVNAIAMGLQAGENDQNNGSIAIGYLVGQYSQGTFAIGIGYGAARSNQSVNAIAFGTTAGSNTQGSAAIALGFQSGQYAQNQDAIALGNSAGRTGQSANAIAIGTTAGISTQGFGAISVGYQSGQNSQGQNAIAIGNSAGRFLQSVNAIAIGTTAGANTQGSAAIALGFQAGQNSEGQNSIAIGNSAGRSSQFANTIAIGTTAGFSTQGTGAIALGFQAGQNAEGENAIAIGNSAGLNTQGSGAIAIGFAAGQISQSTNAIAIGVQAGQSIEAQNSVSIGTQAGQTQQSSGSIALGVQAGQNRQGVNAIAVGVQAGMTGQASGSLALGFQAGMTGQGTNAIAIGNQAGKTDQPSNSIVFNATGTALSSVTKSSAWYVSPISNGTTSNVLYYDSSSAEILYGTAPSGGGVTNGVNYSDYLFWNSYTTSWDAGQRELHLGSEAGLTGQSSFAIALGYQAGLTGQSSNAIAIGNQAGKTNQPVSSIELNATGVALTSVTKSNALYISPMSSITSSNAMYYNPSTAEVSSYPLVSTPTPYYMDFLNTQIYTTAPVTAQVTNPLYTNVIPDFPTEPVIIIPSIFNFSVGTGGDFADLQTALASVSVTNGMNLRMIAGTYTIPDTTGITIDKQVGIYAVDGTVILQTNASASAPVSAISIRAPNVTLYGMTFRHLKTTNTSVESCINVQDTSVSPATGLNNIVIACCVIEFMEFGIIMLGDNFLITKNILSYTSGSNSTRRSIGLYRSTGNSFVTRNTIVDNGASGALRFLALTRTTGTVNEIFSGNLVVSGNIQSATSPLSQFFNQDSWGSTGSNSFNLFVAGNDTNETSAFVVLFYSGANQGDMYDKIVLVNNSCSNNHSGGGKGILALDNGGGASAFRSIGPLPVYASKNVVRNNVWRADYVLATGSSGNIVGRRTTVPDASSNIRSFYGESIAVVSDFSLPLSGINVGGYTLGFYASIAEGVAQLEYKLGYTNSLGYGSAFNILQTGTFDVRSSTATLTNVFLNIPYNLFTIATNRLRLEIDIKNVSGNAPVVIYSRDATNGSFSMVYKFVGYAL